MIVAIMQPYFLPYIGYFQLMSKVDAFVFYDDVQYMKGGWINRNRILRHDKPAYVTLPVNHDDFRRTIRERSYGLDDKIVRSLVGSVAAAYSGAPFADTAVPFFQETVGSTQRNVAEFNIDSLKTLANRVSLHAKLLTASELEGHRHLQGQERVIALCRELGATTYINALGGISLYDERTFLHAGVLLRYLRPELSPYQQFTAPFVPGLSILDAMMFNDDHALRLLVEGGEVITPSQAAAT